MDVKRKRGRPPKTPSQKKEQRLDIRVSESEKQAFKFAAESSEQDLSVWIRIQLQRAASESIERSKDG
jgi:uncharacterized protein (DUF1778 family)